MEMENFRIAINAVVPLLFYICLGYITRARGVADKEMFRRMNRLCFRVFYVFISFYNVCQTDFNTGEHGRLALFVLISFTVFMVILLLVVPHCVKENEKRGVVMQGIYRSNSVFFAIPLAQSVFGQEGASLAGLIVSFMVPIYNVLSVVILEYYHEKNIDPLGLLKNVLKNPLVLGAIAGLAYKLLPFGMPECLWIPVTKIAELTSPLCLFILGGSLTLSSVGGNLKYLLPILFTKLVAVPALILALAVSLGFSPLQRFVAFCLFATPVAAASFPMAQELGGDSELAAEIVVFSTAASGVTLVAWIYFMKTIGVF